MHAKGRRRLHAVNIIGKSNKRLERNVLCFAAANLARKVSLVAFFLGAVKAMRGCQCTYLEKPNEGTRMRSRKGMIKHGHRDQPVLTLSATRFPGGGFKTVMLNAPLRETSSEGIQLMSIRRVRGVKYSKGLRVSVREDQ